MPRDNSFQYADSGEQVKARIANVNFENLDGGGIAVFVNGRMESYDGGAAGRLRARIPVDEDLDGDGKSDLKEALKSAAADLELDIAPAQFRDLIVLFAQYAVTHKANQD